MKATHWHVQECAFTCNDPFVTQLKRHLTLKDKERLFLSAVNVRWRTGAGRHDGFERGVRAVCLLACGKEPVHIANNADATAFAGLSNRCWAVHGHCWTSIGF